MNIKTSTKRKILSTLFSSVLILSFLLVPVSQTAEVQKAEAQWAVVDIPQTVVNTVSQVSTVISEAYSFALKNKELVLDGIAWGLANVVVKEMIKAMTRWVNSGFEGSPAFVTDLEGFLLNVGDKAAGNFIYGSALSGLCSPFSLDIKMALHMQYAETHDYKAECTLSGVVNNMENFLGGDFLEGGWQGWFSMTMEPKNNPYGALLEAEGALALEVEGARNREFQLMSFGNGFLSQRDPNCKPSEDNPDDFDPSRCGVVTPGTVIQTQLNTSLSLPAGRLQVADEINELIGALFSQLLSSIFESDGGLLGSTEPGGIFDDLDRERDPNDPNLGASAFDDVLAKERQYAGLVNEAHTLLTEAANHWRNEYASNDEDPRTSNEEQCYQAGILPASLRTRLTEINQEVASTSAIVTGLEALKADFLTLSDPEAEEEVINPLLIKYRASSTPEARSNIMRALNALIASGELHDSGDIGRFQAQTLSEIRTAVTEFIGLVDNACEGTGGGGSPNLSNHPSVVPVPGPWNSVIQAAQSNGMIRSYAVPVPSDGRASIRFTQGQTPRTPAGNVTEFYVSKQPGYMPNVPVGERETTPNYRRSVFDNYNSIDIFTREVPEMGLDEETILERRNGYAPRDEGQWYVNVRWTYDSCPPNIGEGNCGFSIQWTNNWP